MIPQVGGFQGCYLDNHRNNWRCARAVRKRPLSLHLLPDTRVHAAIVHHHNGHVYVLDLGSAHGTTINGRRLVPKVPHKVLVGDTLVIGQSTRSYHLRNSFQEGHTSLRQLEDGSTEVCTCSVLGMDRVSE